MSTYLLVESRDAFENLDARRTAELAVRLAKAGNQVTLRLVENGVLAARESAVSQPFAHAAGEGVTVLADAFSLKERGIDAGRLVKGVRESSLDPVIDHLAHGHKVLWH